MRASTTLKTGQSIIAIPTTAGTGSEVTTMAIITDEANKRKFAVHGQHVGAAIALADPN